MMFVIVKWQPTFCQENGAAYHTAKQPVSGFGDQSWRIYRELYPQSQF